MINSFLINFCIIVTLVALSFQIYRNEIKVIEKHPLITKVIVGIAGGLTGFLLMVNTIRIEPSVIIDFRNIIVILCCVFGGPLSAFISAIIIGIARICILGFVPSTYAAILSVLCITMVSSLIYMRVSAFKWKWIIGFILNIFISTIFMATLLIHSSNLLKVLVYYFAGNLIMAVILYVLITYYLDFDKHYVWLIDESTKDSLTGLNNVRAFDSEFNRAINRCSRNDEKLAFLALDIDYFKKVNDTYGHVAGDEVLKGLASLLTETCRVFDIISRNGGEEFTVILQDCPSQHAVVVAERIRKAVEDTEFIINNDISIHITISIGIASYPDNIDDPNILREYADRALYNAKESGRNKVVLYNHMNLIWKNEWASGDLTIDKQHKKLNEFVNCIVEQTLKGADQKVLLNLLEELQQHIVDHFNYEEKCLKEIGYPNLEEHSNLHEKLVMNFLELKDSYLAGKIKPTAFYSFIIEDVILGHLQNDDSKFFSYIKTKNNLSD